MQPYWKSPTTSLGLSYDLSIHNHKIFRRYRMSGTTSTPTREVIIPEFKQIMGHPAPLWMLFMTEFWERFAFYGIRWALVLYIVTQFFQGNAVGEQSANLT